MTEQQLNVITELLNTQEILSIENSGDKATDDNIILVLDSKRIVKIFSSGTQRWQLKSKLHRTDGPAVVYADGSQIWYLNDQELTQEEHARATQTQPSQKPSSTHA